MKEYTFKVKKDKKNSTLTVNISGQLNISNMADIHGELMKAPVDFKKVEIKLNDIEDADLTIIQMLKAYQKECNNNNIAVDFDFNLNEDIKSLFERAGLLTILNKN